MLSTLVLSIWASTVIQNCPITENTKIVGLAHNSKNQIIYCERIIQTNDEQLHIDYLLNNTVFATKDLIFTNSAETPEVIQKDFRSGEARRAEIKQNEIILTYKESSQTNIKSVKFNRPEVEVIDAGFDNFIRHNWNNISETNYTIIKFGSIPHLKILDLRVHRLANKKCKAETDLVATDTCFIVEIDNFLLRILFGKMQLIYDQQQHLTHYFGPINISDEQGEMQSASIDYYYAN